MAPTGKGFYIWQIRRCEGGNVTAIANAAKQAGLRHILVKIADGTSPYNLDPNTGADLVPPLVQALRAQNIEVWGWHYIYGYDPDGEAAIAIQRVRQLGLDGYVIDAEEQFKLPGRDEVARRFMRLLRQALPTFPMALSSYRFPTYHPQFPWQAFLEKVDINMPQVYWVQAHNPGEQLTRCLREFQAITPFRPLIPTGAAFKQGDWQPTSAEIVEFLDTARQLNLSAANFWEWGHTRLYLPALWTTIATYNWPPSPPDHDIVTRYFAALNARDIPRLLDLYAPEAIHVTPQRTIRGRSAIQSWYQTLFSQTLPQATFYLLEETGMPGARHFTWIASSSAGNVVDGRDAFGLVDGKIVYHFTFFTISP